MLLQFSVSNYRAFREQQTLSMAAGIAHDKTLPGNCISSESEALKGSRWVKGVALYGANASGKSTLIHALKALARWVQTSAKTTDPKDPIEHIEPFALDPAAAEEPTAFTIFFVTSDVRYEYQVAATRSRVWFEALRAYPEGKAQTWFEREWVPEDGVYTFSPEQRAAARLFARQIFAAGHGYGMGVAVVLEPDKADVMRCRGGVGTIGWPGAYGGWWQADPNDRSVLIFLAHNMLELSQMAQGIGLGVWSAIASFHAIATS